MKQVVSFILFAASVIAGGCSSFPRDFEAAQSKPISTNSILGPWQGEWVSNGGHHGSLRCILSEAPTQGPTTRANAVDYDARFEAKFLGDLLTAHYSTPLAGTNEGPVIALTGDHPLTGLGGGMYHYAAKVTPTKFDATYKSEDDAGVFRMTRPAK